MRMYKIMVENTKTKKVYESGFSPVNHETASILLSKMTNDSSRRNFLVEIPND